MCGDINKNTMIKIGVVCTVGISSMCDSGIINESAARSDRYDNYLAIP